MPDVSDGLHSIGTCHDSTLEANAAPAESGYSRELVLDLAVHRSLKVHQQFLVQHCSNPLQRRQLGYVVPFSSREIALWEVPAALATSSLRKTQLEATLP